MKSEWSLCEISEEYKRRGYRIKPRDLLDACLAGLLPLPRRERFRTAYEEKHSVLFCNRKWIIASGRVFFKDRYKHMWRKQRDVVRLINAGVKLETVCKYKQITIRKLDYIRKHYVERQYIG
jgi:hypothetical protein